MNECSYFLDNGIFGRYPSQELVDDLIKNHSVTHFIDLTSPNEQRNDDDDDNNNNNNDDVKKKLVTKYTLPTNNAMAFPIKDRSFPHNWKAFATFLLNLAFNILATPGNKVYIHCKGGHGRSGVVVACLIFLLKHGDDGFTIERALKLTREAHGKRLVMRKKWRDIGSPQTRYQLHFVRNFMCPMVVDLYTPLCLHGSVTVVDGDDVYATAGDAYRDSLKRGGESSSSSSSRETMERIVALKFSQNLQLRRRLLDTGLKRFVSASASASASALYFDCVFQFKCNDLNQTKQPLNMKSPLLAKSGPDNFILPPLKMRNAFRITCQRLEQERQCVLSSSSSSSSSSSAEEKIDALTRLRRTAESFVSNVWDETAITGTPFESESRRFYLKMRELRAQLTRDIDFQTN
jgi:hypothetical protein